MKTPEYMNLPDGSGHPMPSMDIPLSYFETFPTNMMSRIQDELIRSAPETPYDLPQDYFMSFQSSLPALLTSEFPATLHSDNPYTVNPGYFPLFVSHLKQQIHQETWIPPKQPLIRFNPISWAIAASLLIMLFLSFNSLILKPDQISPTDAVLLRLSQVPDEDIQAYCTVHNVESEPYTLTNYPELNPTDWNEWETELMDQSLNNLSLDEINNYTF